MASDLNFYLYPVGKILLRLNRKKRVAFATINIAIIALETATLLHAWKLPTYTTSAVTSCISLSSTIPIKGQRIGKIPLLRKKQ